MLIQFFTIHLFAKKIKQSFGNRDILFSAYAEKDVYIPGAL